MPRHRPARLAGMPGIGVDRMGDTADALADVSVLRMENLDTDIPPYAAAQSRRPSARRRRMPPTPICPSSARIICAARPRRM